MALRLVLGVVPVPACIYDDDEDGWLYLRGMLLASVFVSECRLVTRMGGRISGVRCVRRPCASVNV